MSEVRFNAALGALLRGLAETEPRLLERES